MKTMILICALGMARGDCTPDTSVAVLQGPDAGGLAQCGFLGQAYLADTAMANYLDGEHYLKIVCSAGGRQPMIAKPAAADTKVTAAKH